MLSPPKIRKRRSMFYENSPCICPDCGNRLPLTTATSLFPTPIVDPLKINPDLLNNIITSCENRLTERKRHSQKPHHAITAVPSFSCSCYANTSTLVWMEIDTDTWYGPLCRNCFRDREYRIWGDTPGNTRVILVRPAPMIKFLDRLKTAKMYAGRAVRKKSRLPPSGPITTACKPNLPPSEASTRESTAGSLEVPEELLLF